MTGVQRSDYLRRFVELLARRADLLGWLWTAQVGAPISFAIGLIRTGLAPADADARVDLTALGERDAPAH
jgi:acyl-CoA reductase-like NAD-dependent aldehyde dehydrogenase